MALSLLKSALTEVYRGKKDQALENLLGLTLKLNNLSLAVMVIDTRTYIK
jgi:hypothetical protein